MTEQDLRIARELKRRLLEHADIVDFRLYGSRARGDAGEASDMDVFIEVQSLTPEIKDKIQDIVWEVGFHNFVVISPLIVSRQELEETPLRSSAIMRNISQEGLRV